MRLRHRDQPRRFAASVHHPGVEQRIGHDRPATRERRLHDAAGHEGPRHDLRPRPEPLAADVPVRPGELGERRVAIAQHAQPDGIARGQGDDLRRHHAEGRDVDRRQPRRRGWIAGHPVDPDEGVDVAERALAPIERVVLDPAQPEHQAVGGLVRVDRPDGAVVRDADLAVAKRHAAGVDRPHHHRVGEDAVDEHVVLGAQHVAWPEADGRRIAREHAAAEIDGEQAVVVVLHHVEHALVSRRDRAHGAYAGQRDRRVPHEPAVAQRVARDRRAGLRADEHVAGGRDRHARRCARGRQPLDLSELLVEEDERGAAAKQPDQQRLPRELSDRDRVGAGGEIGGGQGAEIRRVTARRLERPQALQRVVAVGVDRAARDDQDGRREDRGVTPHPAARPGVARLTSHPADTGGPPALGGFADVAPQTLRSR